jgi:hypothetical protein
MDSVIAALGKRQVDQPGQQPVESAVGHPRSRFK